MAEYSDSTKSLFARSKNRELQSRGRKEVDKTPEYVKDVNEPVPVASYRDRPGYLKVPVNSTSVFGLFGPSGSGKTTGAGTIFTRCYSRDRLPVNFADTDLHTTNLDNHGGVSKDLIDAMGFYEGETRTEIPQKTVLPKYLLNKMQDRNKPTNVEPFSLGFQDVNESELKFLLGQGLDKNQKQAMQTVLDKVTVDEDLTFDDLKGAAEADDDIHHSTAKKLKRNIKVLEDSEVISSRYRMDVVEVVREGNAFGLGMKGFSRLSPDDYYLMEFMAKKCMEMIIDYNLEQPESERIPLFSIFPEAHHLMPKGEDSILADLVKRNYTFYQRRSDFPGILDSQLPSQISEQLLEEVNHVFIGCDKNDKSLPSSEWKKVLKLMNVVANPQKDNRRWMQKIQTLGHRDFLYVNGSMTDPNDAPIVRFLAPRTSNP